MTTQTYEDFTDFADKYGYDIRAMDDIGLTFLEQPYITAQKYAKRVQEVNLDLVSPANEEIAKEQN